MREARMIDVMPLKIIHETDKAFKTEYIRAGGEVVETWWFPRSVVKTDTVRDVRCVVS